MLEWLAYRQNLCSIPAVIHATMRIGIFCELLPEWAALSNCRTEADSITRFAHNPSSKPRPRVWRFAVD